MCVCMHLCIYIIYIYAQDILYLYILLIYFVQNQSILNVISNCLGPPLKSIPLLGYCQKTRLVCCHLMFWNDKS